MKDKNILKREYDAGLFRFSFNSADKRLAKDINVIGVEKTASKVEGMSLLQRIKKKEDPSKHLPAF